MSTTRCAPRLHYCRRRTTPAAAAVTLKENLLPPAAADAIAAAVPKRDLVPERGAAGDQVSVRPRVLEYSPHMHA